MVDKRAVWAVGGMGGGGMGGGGDFSLPMEPAQFGGGGFAMAAGPAVQAVKTALMQQLEERGESISSLIVSHIAPSVVDEQWRWGRVKSRNWATRC